MAEDENFPHNTVQEQRVVKIFGDQLKIIKEKYVHFSWQQKEQEMYYKKEPVKKNFIMQQFA